MIKFQVFLIFTKLEKIEKVCFALLDTYKVHFYSISTVKND